MDAILTNLTEKDSKLKKIFGSSLELPPSGASGDLYFDLIRTIAFQQLHSAAATKIFDRFILLFDSGYPQPQEITEMEIETLRAVGYSKQKANYLKNIATFALENDFEKRDWDGMSDVEIITFLTQIKGVGEWTVHMILLFSLQRPDVFPTGDFGIQTAMKKLYGLTAEKKELKNKMIDIAEAWIPNRTIVSRYLWRWSDSNK